MTRTRTPFWPEGWASRVSVRCWTCWKGKFCENQPSPPSGWDISTWSFSTIAAAPRMPEASNVSME